MENFIIGDITFHSRLFTGTGKFSSSSLMEEALLASGSELVTVALKRIDSGKQDDDILKHLKYSHIKLLPNTSGVRTAKEAVFAAQLAREALETNFIKLEIHPAQHSNVKGPIFSLLRLGRLDSALIKLVQGFQKDIHHGNEGVQSTTLIPDKWWEMVTKIQR